MCTNRNIRSFCDYMIEYARLFYALCPEHRTYNKARAEEKHGACKYCRRPASGERFAEEVEADGKAVGKPICKLRGDSLRHLFHRHWLSPFSMPIFSSCPFSRRSLFKEAQPPVVFSGPVRRTDPSPGGPFSMLES